MLLKYYEGVDLFEPCPKGIKAIKKLKVTTDKIDKIYPVSMEGFMFDRTYDGIWMSWCVGYLTDDALVKFLRLAK